MLAESLRGGRNDLEMNKAELDIRLDNFEDLGIVEVPSRRLAHR